MKERYHARTFHVPAWMTIHDAVMVLAKNAAKPNGRIVEVGSTHPFGGRPSWCWRHLTHDYRPQLMWTIEWPKPRFTVHGPDNEHGTDPHVYDTETGNVEDTLTIAEARGLAAEYEAEPVLWEERLARSFTERDEAFQTGA